jgi:hypothetical protein
MLKFTRTLSHDLTAYMKHINSTFYTEFYKNTLIHDLISKNLFFFLIYMWLFLNNIKWTKWFEYIFKAALFLFDQTYDSEYFLPKEKYGLKTLQREYQWFESWTIYFVCHCFSCDSGTFFELFFDLFQHRTRLSQHIPFFKTVLLKRWKIDYFFYSYKFKLKM